MSYKEAKRDSPLSSRLGYLMHCIDTIFKYFSILCFVAIIASVLLQVFSRFLLPSAPSWTEELSRYCFVYLVASAVGLAWRDGDFIALDLYQHKLGEKGRGIYQLVVATVAFASSVAVMPLTLELIKVGEFQRSPALLLPMKYVYFGTLLICLNIAFYSLRDAIKQIRVLTCRGG